MDEEEISLSGGRFTPGVVRLGDTVRRPLREGLAESLLGYLAEAGFSGAPRFLGRDDKSRAILTYVEGSVPSELGHFDDAALAAAAGLLRRFHDATVEFPVVVEASAEVVCHNDFSPTNAVFRDGLSIALIDFDTLAPGARLWDLGYSAFTWLDLGNDDYSGAEQLRRLAVFADGYGLAACPAEAILSHAVVRQNALAAKARAAGQSDMAEWATAAAEWTARHMASKSMP
ncbi:phosphotransferase [Martelella sp. FLE1502]